MMNARLSKKIFLCALSAAFFLGPLIVSANTASDGASWLSKIFSWQMPLSSHLSSLFEARKDNVESNSVERNQLVDWHRGSVIIDASSTMTNDIDASSSPVTIPYSLFEGKKASIAVELLSAENGLRTSRAELSDFIESSSANGKDMSAASAALAVADTEISDAASAISTFESYEPSPANASSSVDLKVPQSYLDAAIANIRDARSSLTFAIREAGISH